MTPAQFKQWEAILPKRAAKIVNEYLNSGDSDYSVNQKTILIKDLDPHVKRAEILERLCMHCFFDYYNHLDNQQDVERLRRNAPVFRSLIKDYNYDDNALDAKLLTTPNFINDLCCYLTTSECDDLVLQAWFQELSNQLVINKDVTPDTADQMHI